VGQQQHRGNITIRKLIFFYPQHSDQPWVEPRKLKGLKFISAEALREGDTLDPPLQLRPYIAVFNCQDVRASLSSETECIYQSMSQNQEPFM
jgi:hypothetical protein